MKALRERIWEEERGGSKNILYAGRSANCPYFSCNGKGISRRKKRRIYAHKFEGSLISNGKDKKENQGRRQKEKMTLPNPRDSCPSKIG